MSFFDKIKATLSSGKLKKEQIERLRESIWTAVADGEINDRELEFINSLFFESELSAEEFQKLRSEIFLQVVQQAIADRRVGQSELDVLNHLIARLEISPDVEEHAKNQVRYFAEISRIESGAPLHVGQPSGLILKKNELCHLSLPATLLEERVISRHYVGGSRGVGIRIMKGVTYRVGQQQGQMQSQTGMVEISDGYFIVTNQRLVFSGNRKSVSTPFNKLLDLHIFSNGLNFSSSLRQKPVIVRVSRSEEAELCGVLISRLINE
jgi:hypothetical protein